MLDKAEVIQNEYKEISVIESNIALENNNDRDILLDFKEKLIAKEMKFLKLHVFGYRIIKAMNMVSFTKVSNSYKYLLAKRIIEKYEPQAADHRNVFRMVRLNAYALAAKVLGLQKEVIVRMLGATVVVTGKHDSQASPGRSAAFTQERPKPAHQMGSITK